MIRLLIRKLGLGILAREIRAAAEGQRGPTLQKLYHALAGYKTVTGVLLLVATGVLVGLGNLGGEAWITGPFGALMVSVGLIDKSWRETASLTLERLVLYRFARDHAADLAALLGTASAWVTTCEPGAVSALARVHLTCSSASVSLACLSAVFVQLGLMSAARLAAPPR